MMTVLLERRIGRTLTALMARFSAPEWNGARLEAWLFEDAPARRAAEVTLGHAGVQAKLRSAYKPLLHAVLEEIDLAGCDAVTLHLPTHELAAPRRFALETYPLAGLLGATPLHFANGDAPLEYSVAVMRAGATTTHRVFAPNRMRTDPTGQDCLGACGWLRVWRDGALVEDAPLKTEFEAAYDTVMATIAAHPWPAATPYFATLEIVVHIAGIERPLP